MSTLLDTALQFHAWEANVNAIKKRAKQPLNKWKELHERRQEQDELKAYAWGSAGGVGVNNGPGGWHTFDIDAIKDPVTHLPTHDVSEAALYTLLGVLGLPKDYAWVWRGRGGWALALRCAETLPPSVLPAAKKESGVFWGYPAKDSGTDWDHIELRWEHCQTVYPPSQHPSGVVYQWRNEPPTEPPTEVHIPRIIEAFYTLCPPPPHNMGTIDDATKNTIRQQFDLVAYAQRTFGGDLEREGDEVRITGHGGLLINPATKEWYNHRDELGGDCFDLVAYGKYQTRAQNLNGKSSEILALTAEYAGVILPQRKPDNAPPSNSLDQADSPDAQPLIDTLSGIEDVDAFKQAAIDLADRAAQIAPKDLLTLGNTIAARTTKAWAREWRSTVNEYRKPKKAAPKPQNEAEDEGKRKRDDWENESRHSDVIVDALASLGYHFALNRCADVVEVNSEPIDDIQRSQIKAQLRNLDFRSMEAAEDAWIAEAAKNSYHPIKDYLTGLKWDGVDRIAQLAAKCKSTDQPIEYADGSAASLLSVYFRRWLIGAVAKVLAHEQNVMLVLSGPQGIGKSELVRWLCSGLSAYFIEAPIRVEDKDCDVRLMSRFIWEVSELDATTRKADVAALKAFITKNVVTVRKAYGRNDTVKPAIASLIGTVNDGAGFLSDESGNRRFMVTSIQHIDWSYKQIDISQIWAQAVALYHAGEPWRLQPEEMSRQQEENRNYETDSLLEGWILKWFDLKAGPGAMMKAADIVDHLHDKDVQLNGTPKALAMEISQVLTRLGVQRASGRNRRCFQGIASVETANRISPISGDNLGDNLGGKVVTENTASESLGDNRDNRDNLFETSYLESIDDEEGTPEVTHTHTDDRGVIAESSEGIYKNRLSQVGTLSQVVTDELLGSIPDERKIRDIGYRVLRIADGWHVYTPRNQATGPHETRADAMAFAWSDYCSEQLTGDSDAS